MSSFVHEPEAARVGVDADGVGAHPFGEQLERREAARLSEVEENEGEENEDEERGRRTDVEDRGQRERIEEHGRITEIEKNEVEE